MTVSDLFPHLFATGTPTGGSALLINAVPILLVLGIFYFLVLMPMKKRQQKVQAFLGALKENERVITSGGVYGTIVKLKDQSVQLQIAPNVRIEVSRAAIVGYQGQEPVAEGLSQGNQ